jgi:hypothetical protein
LTANTNLNDPTAAAIADAVWDEAIAQAAIETGLADFPEACPWSTDEIFSETWFPS